MSTFAQRLSGLLQEGQTPFLNAQVVIAAFQALDASRLDALKRAVADLEAHVNANSTVQEEAAAKAAEAKEAKAKEDKFKARAKKAAATRLARKKAAEAKAAAAPADSNNA